MDAVRSAVVAAELDLANGADPAAVGAAVSDELCGRWDHDGPCRWPHRNIIETDSKPAHFSTVVVAVEDEMPEVLERIEKALRSDRRWLVVSAGARETQTAEDKISDHLATLPRLS